MPGKLVAIEERKAPKGPGDGHRGTEVLAKIGKAKELIDASKPMDALAMLEPLLKELEPLDDMKGLRALTRAYLATAHQLLGNIDKSLACTKSALELSGGTGVDPLIKGEVHLAHGVALRIKGDQNESVVFLARALALFEACHDKEAVARTCRAIGSAYLNLGLYVKGLAYLNRSLKFYEDIGDRSAMNASLNNIALSKGFQGMTEEALKDYEKLLSLGEAAGDDRQLATVSVNLGHFNNRLQRWDIALAHYERAEAAVSRLSDKRLGAFIAFGRAEALAGKGMLDEADRVIDASFDEIAATKSDEAMAWTLRARGIVARERGDLGRAQDDFALAEKFLSKGAFAYIITRVYIDWGKTLFKAGDIKGARALFEKARDVFKRNKLPLLEKELDETVADCRL